MDKKQTAIYIFLYTLITLVTNYIFSIFCARFILPINTVILSNLVLSPFAREFLGLTTFSVINLILSIAVISLSIIFLFPNVYKNIENKKDLKRNLFSLVFIGETIRFLICLIRLGASNLASIPSSIFALYMSFSGRALDILNGSALFVDYVLYAIIYFVYITIYLLGIITICKLIWKKSKQQTLNKERNKFNFRLND